MVRSFFALIAIALTLSGGVVLGVNADRAGLLPDEIKPLLISEPHARESTSEIGENAEAEVFDRESFERESFKNESSEGSAFEAEQCAGERDFEHNVHAQASDEVIDLGVLVVPRRQSITAADDVELLLDGGIRLGAVTAFEFEAVDAPSGTDFIAEETELPAEEHLLEEGEADGRIARTRGRRVNRASRTRSERSAQTSSRRAARNPRSTRARPALPPSPPPSAPRLHPNAGMHTILTARRMISNGEQLTGSCYNYIATVFQRAGHNHWSRRQVVYRGDKDDRTFADLNTIRPGDWLYIVRHPDRRPVGTHSVLFVGWEDRARGRARVLSHPGSGRTHTGAERTYDISRTYRITRPI